VKFKQFAALPFRTREDDLEILLITTRKKRRWSVPKGWPIKRTAPHETAVIEAYEEAGVRGAIGEKQIGRFRKRRQRKKQSVLCEVQIFPLEVTHEQNDWPEKRERNRMWVASKSCQTREEVRAAAGHRGFGNQQISALPLVLIGAREHLVGLRANRYQPRAARG
jgi:8-oxo-dGTP pyrophosphatase MutT (NUDIX family)